MTELLTAAQMRAIEQAAIRSGQVTGLQLMERAGRGVVEAVFDEWPELAARSGRAVVLCGPGNNGGDGFVIARVLKDRGWEVEVFLYGDPERLPPDARANYERWAGDTNALTAGCIDPEGVDLAVDALFGTGLTRAAELHLFEVVKGGVLGVASQDTRWVSVDVPSGLCADSGRALGLFCNADLTVTFERAKRGHHLAQGPEICGVVSIRSIGLESWLDDLSRIEILDEEPVLLVGTPRRLNKSSEHKYSHGHALILSGGPGRTGAARLAARGALRIGAGLVTLGVPPAAQMEVACQITALMLRRVEDAVALADVLSDERLNALCLGPVLGLERARELVPLALAAARPTVLDADALTAFAENPAELFGLLHYKCVLTPHGGEFARLFPDLADRLNGLPTSGPAYSKVDATREAAARAGCVVLFKGPDTVIAEPDGRCSVNSAFYERAAPWLATAGSGDVLAGFITGLMARGFDPMQAAEIAAWLHVESARHFGPGLIAEDLPEQVPAVLRSLKK